MSRCVDIQVSLPAHVGYRQRVCLKEAGFRADVRSRELYFYRCWCIMCCNVGVAVPLCWLALKDHNIPESKFDYDDEEFPGF